MSSGFGALRDNRVNPALLQHSRFRHGRRAGNDENAGGFDRRDDLRLRQAEMKADELRFRLQQHRDVFSLTSLAAPCGSGTGPRPLAS
jgi:hypothetical protein